jgi:hypothetical protein
VPVEDRAGASPAGTVRLVAVLGSVNAIGPLSIDTYLPAFPEITRTLHPSASEVQPTLTRRSRCVCHLVLDSTAIPLDDCVELIAAAATARDARSAPA